jgi:hypothetical protein
MADEEELLRMAEALEEIEELTAEERKFVERMLDYLGDEKKVPKKDQQALVHLYKEHVKDPDLEESDDDVDEDDFV